MRIAALGVNPLPETSRLLVGGPLVGENETVGWLKQIPATNSTTVDSRHTCRVAAGATIFILLILSSLSCVGWCREDLYDRLHLGRADQGLEHVASRRGGRKSAAKQRIFRRSGAPQRDARVLSRQWHLSG